MICNEYGVCECSVCKVVMFKPIYHSVYYPLFGKSSAPHIIIIPIMTDTLNSFPDLFTELYIKTTPALNSSPLAWLVPWQQRHVQ